MIREVGFFTLQEIHQFDIMNYHWSLLKLSGDAAPLKRTAIPVEHLIHVYMLM